MGFLLENDMSYEWYKVDGIDEFVVADEHGVVVHSTPYAAEAKQRADELNGGE